MTNSEIRARLERMKNIANRMRFDVIVGWQDMDWAVEAIETLLAREAAVLEIVDNFDPTWPEDGLRKIRAIFNPQEAYTMTEPELRHYQNHLRDRAEIEGRD